MKTLFPLNKLFASKSLSVISIAAMALASPSLAGATDYATSYHADRGYTNTYQRGVRKDCNSRENEAKLIGGIIGTVVGGVVGSQVSGNGARTEGSAIGAVLGGLAGAGLGDESVNCRKERNTNRYSGNVYGQNTGYNTGVVGPRNSTYRTVYTSPLPRTTEVSHRTYRNNGYTTTHGTSHGHSYGNGYGNDYGYQEQRERKLVKVRTKLSNVRNRLRDLYAENDRLERKLRRQHRHYDNRWVSERKVVVCSEIERLEAKKSRLKQRKRRILRS